MIELLNQVTKGDCLEVMKNIPDGFVDMVLCDLPYGVTANQWDELIPFEPLWELYRRIIKDNGAIVLTGQGLFTGKLISSNLDWFKYKIVWIKCTATNFLNANKQPLRRHEDICVFYRNQPHFDPQKTKRIPYDKGIRKDNRSGNYGSYGSAHIISADGMRYPHDVQFYEDDFIDWVSFKPEQHKVYYHPTQKPVDLGRWLIRTFTKPGEIVLDNCCGSGSFLVSAILEKRQFIGIEANEHPFHLQGRRVNFISICRARIQTAYNEVGNLLL